MKCSIIDLAILYSIMYVGGLVGVFFSIRFIVNDNNWMWLFVGIPSVCSMLYARIRTEKIKNA